ncbi:hypothetical protein AAG897_12715 [Lacticaseibacillus rhamnosus]|uniref:hypothetical protein n=1 Tax=Lacticaseibacillus rhamnosus TaxID=47715 RepID=UPI0031F4BFA9
MRVFQQHSSGIILNAIKSYDELTDEEKAAMRLEYGTSKEDYATYQVRRNKHNEIRQVTGYEYSAKKKAEIKAQSSKPSIVDAMNVLYGKGKQKAEAVDKYREAGIDPKDVESTLNPVRHGNLLDAYLEEQGTTRYQVSKKGDIASMTLANAAKKARAIEISTRVILAIAKALQKKPGEVLDGLILTEVHLDEKGQRV